MSDLMLNLPKNFATQIKPKILEFLAKKLRDELEITQHVFLLHQIGVLLMHDTNSHLTALFQLLRIMKDKPSKCIKNGRKLKSLEATIIKGSKPYFQSDDLTEEIMMDLA